MMPLYRMLSIISAKRVAVADNTFFFYQLETIKVKSFEIVHICVSALFFSNPLLESKIINNWTELMYTRYLVYLAKINKICNNIHPIIHRIHLD